MEFKNKLVIVEGYASLVSEIRAKGEKTISHDALPIIMNKLKIDTWKEIHSTKTKSEEMFKAFLLNNANPDTNLFILTKSRGGAEVVNIFTKMKDEGELNYLSRYRKIVWVSVDMHNPWFMSGKTYNHKHDYIPGELTEYVTIYNYFQYDKYPQGTYIHGADFGEKVPNSDHWKIVDCKLVLDGIAKACKELKNS